MQRSNRQKVNMKKKDSPSRGRLSENETAPGVGGVSSPDKEEARRRLPQNLLVVFDGPVDREPPLTNVRLAASPDDHNVRLPGRRMGKPSVKHLP